MSANPLLQTPLVDDHHNIPFPAIRDEHFAPALEEGIRRAKAALEKLTADPSAPTFANTIEAIEFHKEDLERVSLVFFNLVSAHTNDSLQALAKDVSPQLAELANDLLLSAPLFDRVKAVFGQADQLGLNLEQKQLLEKTYRAFRRNGALLAPGQKEELRSIDRELARLTQDFSDHILKATNEFLLFVDDEACLKDIPAPVLEDAKNTAREKGRPEAWAFSLHQPSFFPFLQYCTREDLRQQLWLAVASRGMKAPHDNRQIAKDIARLRHGRARLLGFETHAAFVLEERMAGSPEKVREFLEDLLSHSRPAADRDFAELREAKRRHSGKDDLRPWDVAFYSERLRREKFDLSEEELRPYFPLERVIGGVFEHARQLFGLSFRERPDLPVYHPDVKAYEVRDEKTGRFTAFFYADFFPRASKKGGAWMTNFLEQGIWGGQPCRPHVSIVCNFTKPGSDQPSLLTLEEVRTLFHEFGHALHSMLSDCHYASLAGTNVYWDFVELPSQVMENWALEKEGLALFARHYQTGAPIPDELVAKIKAAANFQAGWMAVRQLSFGFLDMAWHGADPSDVQEIESFEREQIERTLFFPAVEGTSVSAAFSHIFAGGYSAGYYSYKWAEVLDADAFELFQEKGLFNREVADQFRSHVLSRGGTEHPMELYKRFRGREPDPKALLRREGLIPGRK